MSDGQRQQWRAAKQEQRRAGKGWVDTRPIAVRRAAWRKTKQKMRLRAQEQQSFKRGRCTVKRNGNGKACGAKLEARFERDGYGVVVRSRYVCPSCERRRAGVCARCPRPVAGRVGFALYCDDAECKRLVRKAYRLGLDPRMVQC